MSRRLRRVLGVGIWALGFLAAAGATFLPQSLHAAGRTISLRTTDGRTIAGLMIDASDRPAPAVVLVPMLGRTKDDWQAVAQRLADANITALAIDLPSATVSDPADLAGWHLVVDAAVAYLAMRPAEVNAAAIGVAGASIGANLAAVAAGANPAVRSLALVSPSLDYRGVRIEPSLAQYGARPVLLVGSLHDPYAARSIRTLAQDAPGPRQMRWSTTAAHGSLLLSRDPDLVRSLIEWFQQTLAVS
jgi:dienelactone hydrolase